MAPSPDNDTPKAPDKTDKDKPDVSPEENNKHDQTLSDLNDRELKALLDEAANYKNPKDREGKSSLFNYLLNEAEQKERNAMAARAGGSELVRYCNPSAKRSRHRKKPSSISENMMHGGSLDNLAKEELFETSKHRTKKSVSARQREGGSLPCNVNASTVANLEYKFLEEARKEKEMREKMAHDLEAESLLEHDCLAQDYQEQVPPVEVVHYPAAPPAKYTSRATLQINSKVDDPLQVSLLEPNLDQRRNFYQQPNQTQIGNKYVYFPSTCLGSGGIVEDGKKVDENGNALQQNALKGKKKKLVTDKNVVVCNAESVKGHRSDIINDMEKLIEFIGGESSGKKRLKSKQVNPNVPTDDTTAGKNKKQQQQQQQRAHSSKTKDDRSELTKSNSLGEISTTNLDDFCFHKDNVVMRNNKNSTDKPRERRSWGNMEPLPIQTLYTNASAENLESAEFRVVTKKKKSKKRRSSISGRPKPSSVSGGKGHNRGPSPDPRRKSACSVPHSEKSNDSSDSDSVHSLPIDTQHSSHLNMPISYADIARNSETTKSSKEKKPVAANVTNDKVAVVPKETTTSPTVVVAAVVDNSAETTSPSVKNTPPDVHNFKNFPAITKQQSPPPPPALDRSKSSNKIKSSATNNVNKNVKNNVPKASCAAEQNNSVAGDGPVSERAEMHYSASLPPDIPTVQTIEKMQLMGQGHPYGNDGAVAAFSPSTNDCSVDCDNSERTSNVVVDDRPPVVILSGMGNNREVPGLVFGFDINEQLLAEDVDVCDDFISRFVPPDEVFTTTSHNHDKIVNFVGSAWDETVANLSSGKVQYYSDLP